MRIGVDISDLHSGRSDGTTRFTYEIVKRFPVMAPVHEWVYFTSGELHPNFLLPSQNHTLLVSPWLKYWTQMRFPIELYREHVDVLLMPIQQLPYLRPGTTKTVSVIHDLAFHIYPEQFTYRDWLLQHIFTAYAVREADHLIAVSGATAADISYFYGRDDDISIVHHGLDHDSFRIPLGKHGEESWEELLAWQPNLRKPYALYVGQIQPRKNLLKLMQAFELLAHEDDSFETLVLAGSHGWLNAPIYTAARASSVASRIVMPGRVPDALLPALYRHAAVFVLPSLYEGFGIPIIEAMASGCPVVTSNVSSMPEVAGDAAVFINPHSVESLVGGMREAMQRRETLRAAGEKRASVFNWEATTRGILGVLEGLS